jgi:LacI family transcriptional regulator
MNQRPSNSEKKATLADIAQDSGVSVATVSLVLRNKPGVSENTRQRVYDSARALGYIHTVSNQAQARRQPQDIGLIIKVRPDDLPSTNSFYAPVLAGIEAVCRHNRINLMYSNLPVDLGNNPLEIPRTLLEQHVDGALMVGMFLNDEIVQILLSKKLPVLLVDAYADNDYFDSVVTDNFAGAYQTVTHLIEAGHRQIAIVGSQPEAYPSIQERREGYLRALADNDLEPYFADCYLYPEKVPQAVTDLLNSHPDVTALFACNDTVAIAAIQKAQELGRHVPDDLSVVGFDNIELAQHVAPPLTTMRVDMMGMGRLAAQLLMNRYEFPEAGRVRTIICPRLVSRASVKVLTT